MLAESGNIEVDSPVCPKCNVQMPVTGVQRTKVPFPQVLPEYALMVIT